MKVYDAVKNRIFELLYENKLSIHKLAINSGVAPSTIKNILYGKSQNPGIATLKMLCDGMDISLIDFFNTDEFNNLPQELE
ncbi:MAG: helix-turn-helix transcriptional regulator [Clostridia bacterium]|nr:helix-turn-helix transcriptional regulator [Clostridia bacterium]